MTWTTPLRSACSTALALLGLSLLVPMPVAAEELVFKVSFKFCAEIDGVESTEARFFVSDPPGRLLVELPSLSTSVLLASDAKKALRLTPANIRREANPSSLRNGEDADNGEEDTRLMVQLPQGAVSYPVSMDKGAWNFEIEDLPAAPQVRVQHATECRKAAAALIPTAGQELVLQACNDYCAKIDGAYAPDARFFTTEPKDRILVDFPSLSASTLLTLKAQKLVTLPRSTFKLESGDRKARLVNQISPEAPVASVSMDGSVWRFKIRDADVSILKASECHPVVAPLPPNEPVRDDPKAKNCLHLNARPIPETAGCTKGVFLRNSCDAPVVALIQTTQHLFSGTLPQTSSVVVPPGSDYPLGCAWSRGAMGPENYEVLAAAFATRPGGSEAGERHSTGH